MRANMHPQTIWEILESVFLTLISAAINNVTMVTAGTACVYWLLKSLNHLNAWIAAVTPSIAFTTLILALLYNLIKTVRAWRNKE